MRNRTSNGSSTRMIRRDGTPLVSRISESQYECSSGDSG
jgi:hypothetical protein